LYAKHGRSFIYSEMIRSMQSILTKRKGNFNIALLACTSIMIAWKLRILKRSFNWLSCSFLLSALTELVSNEYQCSHWFIYHNPIWTFYMIKKRITQCKISSPCLVNCFVWNCFTSLALCVYFLHSYMQVAVVTCK